MTEMTVCVCHSVTSIQKSQFSVKVVHRNVPLTTTICLDFYANIFHDEFARKGHYFDNINVHSIYVAIELAAVLTASDFRMRENYVITGIPKRSYNFSKNVQLTVCHQLWHTLS